MCSQNMKPSNIKTNRILAIFLSVKQEQVTGTGHFPLSLSSSLPSLSLSRALQFPHLSLLSPKHKRKDISIRVNTALLQTHRPTMASCEEHLQRRRRRREKRVVLCILVFCITMLNQLVLQAEGAFKAPPVHVGNISKVLDAELFHIYYGQSFKVIKNSFDGKSYLLMQSNSRMATRTKYCTGRIKSFVIPLSSYSADTAYLPLSFFELLGISESLKGLTSDQVTSECILKSISSGGIQLIDESDIQGLAKFAAHFISKADEQACNFAAFVPLNERTPLQRAEWIKYLATFTNSEYQANSIYDAVKANYNCLSKAAASLTTQFKPIVAWVECNQGMWSFAKEDYKLQYVRDAGGENIDDTITSSSYNSSDPEDMDNLQAILCTVDVVIDQTYSSAPSEYKLSNFMENLDINDNSCCGFLTNQSLWRYDKRVHSSGAIDWYDGAISQPQLVLADLMESFFPTGNYRTTYFRNLAKEEEVTIISPEMCDRSLSTPKEPTIVPCQ